MNPFTTNDMAAPNPQLHRLSHLSTSTMDEDVLSDFHRCSLSGTDSLLTDITEYEPIERGDSCPKWAGLTARNRFSQSYDKNQDCYSSQEGEGDAAFNANELMPVRSTMQAPTRPPESAANRPCRDVEHLGVKQTVEVLQSIPGSPHLQRSFTFDREQLDEPGTIVERAISDKEKKSKISTLFARAASNGDISRIIEILDNFRDWVDINTHEEDGSTPLIYAACFGQTAVVFMLLDAGAQVDARDKFGWTALVWATNNKHEDIVRLLLDHGASPSAQTVKGRTVADFLRHDPNDTTKIAQIFREPTTTRSNFASKSPFMRANAALMNQDQFYQEIMTEDERQHRLNMGSSQNLVDDMTENDRFLSDQADDDNEFNWELCLPDQMFVFSSRDIPHIIETVITTIEPARSRSYKPIPAYVLFLSARFAHNFSTPELLEELLEATVTAIRSVTKIKPDDMALTAYWISNTSSFIHFLRKDAGLRHTSEAYQEKLEMLLQDMVHTIIQDAERRMEQILEPAMLEHDTIMGLDEVRFQSVWAFNFWRGIGSGGRTNKRASAPPVPSSQSRSTESLRRTSLQAQRPSSPTQRSITPRTVTTMMSSLLFVMQIYDVHPEIIYYVIAQLLYYISCEVFNLMVENRKFLSRSKALQTRLNLSILEDWLRNNQLPSRLTDQLAALVQLLQLLQVLSQQSDLTTWIETRKKVELLNPAQVKHVVSAYRYEVKEQRLPAEVTKYVLQVVADTEKVRRQEAEAASSGSESSSRRASSQISGSRAASIFEAEENRMDKARRTRSGSRSGDSNTERDEEDADQMSLTMNSKIWNHFLMPKNLAARDGGIERVFVPQIPEDVMSLLDSKTYF